MIIRRATPDDAEKLAIYMASIHAESPDTIFKRSNVPTADDALHLIQLLSLKESSLLLIAESENHIIGMLDFGVFKELQRSHSGQFGMSVLKEFRGKGIGRKLIQILLNELESTPVFRVELQVFSNNLNAIKLYESLGFEHEGRKRNAVRVGEEYCDILLMAKFLKAF